MPVISGADLNESAAPGIEDCDVCIVGTGPAGSTIARELSNSFLKIVLLESGGIHRSAQVDELNEIENVGRPRMMDQWRVRNRVVGGSSHTWTGRCAAFDEVDFMERDWVPDSGWPIDLASLDPFLARSASYLGLTVGNGFSDDRFWDLAGRPRPTEIPNPALLLPFFWQFSRDDTNRYEYMRFGRRLAEQVGSNVTLVTEATVVSINPDASGQTAESVDYIVPSGVRRTVRAKRIILCAGAIENARLLLSSDTVIPNGLGNQYDLVGRYLMDHPRSRVASFELAGTEVLQKRLGLYNVRGNLFRAGFRLSPQVQREEGLLNCSIWLGESLSEDDPWHAVKRILRGKADIGKDFLTVARNADLFARGLKGYFIDRNGLPRKLVGLNLDGMCEQRPDPESRVTLSDRRDRLGMRLSRIDWRIHDDEPRSLRRTAELAVAEFARMGLPTPRPDEWVRDKADFPSEVIDCAHPTGTTRMSLSARTGVVDIDGQVHGIEGLYVAGSSIFPTAGHCNPTQMIVATAIRIADRVKETSRIASFVPSGDLRERTSDLETSQGGLARKDPVVLVTGASGHIGRVVTRYFVEHGYKVRATTSKPLSELNKNQSQVDWFHLNLQKYAIDPDLLRGCSAVVHLAAEMYDPKYMHAVNVEGTYALARAAESAGVRTFVYISSASVYGSSFSRVITEETPVLTADRDVRSEYLAVDQLRAYGRTKLGGENALRAAQQTMNCIVLRPTVVVDVDRVKAIREWDPVKRYIAAYRYSHYINVSDVADAILWSVERAHRSASGSRLYEVFNVSEDDHPEATFFDFMRKAYRVSGNAAFRTKKLPWIVDWLRDAAKFRIISRRYPAGLVRFRSDRLHAAGWRPRFGMTPVYEDALASFKREAARA